MRLIRVMCSGRVDLSHVFRAFSRGADGVFIGACHLNECNYITHGNYHALITSHIGKKLLELIGLNPERLKIKFMSGSEANVYVDGVNGFVKDIKGLGPIGEAEGLTERETRFRLEAVLNLIPYMRMVEKERLKIRFMPEEEYAKFFQTDEIRNLFERTVADKLEITEIVAILQDGPSTAAQIAEALGLDTAKALEHLAACAKQGLVRYDEGADRYVLTTDDPCPALAFKDIVSYYVDPEKCQACGTCRRKCPVDAIDGGKRLVHIIDQDKCVRCGTCFEVCPPRFGAVTKLSGEPAPPRIPEEERAVRKKAKEQVAN